MAPKARSTYQGSSVCGLSLRFDDDLAALLPKLKVHQNSGEIKIVDYLLLCLQLLCITPEECSSQAIFLSISSMRWLPSSKCCEQTHSEAMGHCISENGIHAGKDQWAGLPRESSTTPASVAAHLNLARRALNSQAWFGHGRSRQVSASS